MPALKSRRRTASRLRFDEYREARAKRRSTAAPAGVDRSPVANRSFWMLLRDFLGLLRGHRASLAFALATVSLATLLKLIPPAATKLVIDYVLLNEPLPPGVAERLYVPADPKTRLVLLAGAVLLVAFLATGLRLWGRWRATLASKRLQVGIRRRVFEQAARLPLHRVHELKSGGVASLLREDAGGVGELIFSMLYNPWRAITQLTGGLIVLAWVDWRMLTGALVLLPAVFWTHRVWIRSIRPIYRDVRRQRQDIDAHATEAFGGMRVVRAFGRQKAETARFVRENHFMARQELDVWWRTRLIEVVWDLLLPIGTGGLLLYGGLQVLNGRLSLGDLMMFLVYLAMLLEPLAVIATSATQFQNNLAGFDRVLDLLAEPRELADHPGGVVLTKSAVRGRIAVRDVSFRYPTGADMALRNVDFEAEPGQIVALVGRSGAGKTTLCNLIARFYSPTVGTIELDGVDLRRIDLDSYRRLLGIVEQDVFLFDGTVAENIGYAVRNAGLEDVKRAAAVANAHRFITELPEGYETLIGERGVRLSGGQRQRIAIARAVLADPRILILDEATSNLDTESERLIQSSLTELMRSRTSFVIAHRLSTVKIADRILVLERGCIVESGSHDDLMCRSSRYRDMVQLQQLANDGRQ